jgi:Pup amidohydrolase
MNRQERERSESKAAGARTLPVPKMCGADMELGNFILGESGGHDSCYDAACALLRQTQGQAGDQASGAVTYGTPCRVAGASRYNDDQDEWSDDDYGGRSVGYGGGRSGYNPQDWGRKYLRSNGGCAYIDSGHFEVCTPEVISVYDFVAASHAMFRIARQAQAQANENRAPNRKIQVLANNTDGHGNSYGSHINFLVRRDTYEDIFHRRMHYMLFLAAHQVSSIVYTGAGKVGSENGRDRVDHQISARADFFETLTGEQTMYRRPIVNSRDESLCGGRRGGLLQERSPSESLARLHVIFYDNTLCHSATLLKVGVMQIILAMIERGRVDPDLILDDPIAALNAFSHDCALRSRASTVRGRELTAVELQMRFFEEASEFVAGGGCDGVVPHAREILTLWGDTLTKLRAASSSGDLDALLPLAPRIDWVLKLFILRRAMEQNPDLSWDSPQIRHLDQLYSSLDPHEGLYWAYERAGFTEQMVSDARIERFVHEPPVDTRAWMRTMLLRLADQDQIVHVDWDSIRFRFERAGYYLPTYRTVELNDPLSFKQSECEPLLRGTPRLDEVLDALEQDTRRES